MNTTTTLDKDSITWGQKQYHIALCPEDIGEYVLLPGDPARSDIAAKYLDNAELKEITGNTEPLPAITRV